MSRGRNIVVPSSGGSKNKLIELGIFTGLVMVASTAIYLPFFSSFSEERKEQVRNGNIFGYSQTELISNQEPPTERVPGSVWKNITKVRDAKAE